MSATIARTNPSRFASVVSTLGIVVILLVVILVLLFAGSVIGLAFSLFWLALTGLVIGALGRLVLPGRQDIGLLGNRTRRNRLEPPGRHPGQRVRRRLDHPVPRGDRGRCHRHRAAGIVGESPDLGVSLLRLSRDSDLDAQRPLLVLLFGVYRRVLRRCRRRSARAPRSTRLTYASTKAWMFSLYVTAPRCISAPTAAEPSTDRGRRRRLGISGRMAACRRT